MAGYRYIKEYTSSHTILNHVRDRMITDIEPYVKFMQKVAKEEHKGVGNFSLFRMIMPLIEVTATATGVSKYSLLIELGVDYPYLCWSLFRDGFMHNDEFIYANAKFDEINYQIYPAIGISAENEEQSHQFTSNFQLINPIKLYYDLLAYINESLTKESKRIKMVSAIEYIDDSDAEVKKIREEIRQLRLLKDR